MEPRIEILSEKKLVGLQITMNLVQNKTGQLWSLFGPRIQDIKHRVSTDKISLQVYPPHYYEAFSPTTEFEKWALVEVTDFDDVPKGLLKFSLESGLVV